MIVLSYGQGSEIPDLKTYSNYDFVPGNKVSFFDDFSQGDIGDFPSVWNSNASGEIIRTNLLPGKWFKMNTEGNFFLDRGLEISENFTIEFDVFITRESEFGDQFIVSLFETEDEDMYPNNLVAGKHGIEIYLSTVESGAEGNEFRSYDHGKNTSFSGTYSKDDAFMKFNKVYRIAIWVQKTRLRLYVDQTKIFDVQRAFPAGAQINQLRFTTHYECFLNVSNFKVADASADTRSQLLTEGKLISYGIYFDTGKDIVKPESYGSVKEIATILKDNPDVRIVITGHTDSDGDAASNLGLSKRRAASVKNALVNEFGIAASRMETDGKGHSESVASNDSPENKAKNRRVEFIKL
jgi:OmpA-OmpF porin, OOP family